MLYSIPYGRGGVRVFAWGGGQNISLSTFCFPDLIIFVLKIIAIMGRGIIDITVRDWADKQKKRRARIIAMGG